MPNTPGANVEPNERPSPENAYSPAQVRRRPPVRRRLQIFAVDPGASNRLETAFLNKTVIDIPSEGGGLRGNQLQPGPVGEYIERRGKLFYEWSMPI
jgi:hypothetical protein